MSSALKPALPSSGGQSPGNASTGAGKPPGMSQHTGATNPYTSAPLGHVAQNLAVGGGLPNAHSNLGLSPQNIAANMSINQVPLSINQTPAHNAVPPLKTPSVPGTLSSHRPPNTQHPYLPAGSGTNASALSSPHEEGTALPPSQNSAHLMAVHRAQQQIQHHPMEPQSADRFKQSQPALTTPQQPPTQLPQAVVPSSQHQSNGMVASPSDMTSSPPKAPLSVPSSPPKPTDSPSSSSNSNSPTVAQPTVAASVALQNHISPSVQQSSTNSNSSNDTSAAIKPATEAPPSPPASDVPVEAKTSTVSVPSVAIAVPAIATPAAVPSIAQEQQPTPEASTVPVTVNKLAALAPAPPKEPPKDPVAAKPQSTLKLATTPRNISNRKREQSKQHISKTDSAAKSKSSPNSKPLDKTPTKTPRSASEERKSKRNRIRTQPYQSPLPELALISKLSNRSSSPAKNQDEKLIVFYKNEFLAVRNADGGFYVCQAVQNVYKSSVRIRIRWLSQDKQDKIYIPDFYDTTEFDCILTNINMNRVEKGKYNLPKDELERTENILKRALAVEKGDSAPALTEEHPDGLDLSLFRDESQLKKKQRKALKRKSRESAADASSSSASPSKNTKKSPERAKARKVTRSPVKASTKKPAPLTSSKATTSSRETRKSDGGRAERAKRRGEVPVTLTVKSSPVLDQKKARVLAKVVLKNAIPISVPSKDKKKKGGKVSGKSNAPLPTATTSKSGSSGGAKTSTRSQGVVASASSASSSTRRKKGRK